MGVSTKNQLWFNPQGQSLYISSIVINDSQCFTLSCIPVPLNGSWFQNFCINKKLKQSHAEKFINYTQEINTDT